jgi:hypothetical protein
LYGAATAFQLVGLASHRLEVPGGRRLEIDHSQVVSEILT